MLVPHACSIPYLVLGCIILAKCPVFISPFSVKVQEPPSFKGADVIAHIDTFETTFSTYGD